MKRPQPRLEFGNAGFGNDDPLGRFDSEVQRETAPEPHGDLLHGLPRDDELAVGPEEFGLGKQSLQRFEGLVQRVGRAVETVGRDLLVRRVAVGDPAAVQRDDFVAHVHQENLLAAAGGQRADPRPT